MWATRLQSTIKSVSVSGQCVSVPNRVTSVSFPGAHFKDVLPRKFLSVSSEIELLFSGTCSVSNGYSHPLPVIEKFILMQKSCLFFFFY